MIETFQFKLGEARCLAVKDGGFTGNADVLFSNAPEDALSQYLDRYGESPDALPSTWTCLLVETNLNTVLIDTGAGILAGSHGGKLEGLLREAGWKPGSIDTVILTHAHGDHIGGCVRKDGTLAFPNARIVMAEAEWNYWMSDDKPSGVSESMLKSAQRVLTSLEESVTLLDGEAKILPGFRILPAHGHTPGHIVIEIESVGKCLLYLADTALHPIHVERPDWYARVDLMPEQTIETRKRLFDLASQTGCLVLMFHFEPFPSLGHIVRYGETWRWQVVELDEAVLQT